MLDFKSHYELLKSVLMHKAKEQHKPTLSNMESMQAYQQATKATGRACFTATQSSMVIDYV